MNPSKLQYHFADVVFAVCGGAIVGQAPALLSLEVGTAGIAILLLGCFYVILAFIPRTPGNNKL